jgi:lincosamide nucleotidyltransferase A/C/D/E
MTAAAVLDFIDLMAARGIRIWLDGGWAVDACLGSQTRSHADLDIVIEARHLDRAVSALRELGYRPAPRDDTRLWNFAMSDSGGSEVDFHVVVLDETGRGIYGPPEDGDSYPAEALAGAGTVEGRAVACITPEYLVKFHTGYAPDENDRADVSALCEKFGIPLPAEYQT